MTLWPLINRGPDGGLQAFRMHLSARRRVPPDVLPVHEGYDWPGEAVEFTTWTPYWFGAADGPAELIAIFGPHGEWFHLHG